jgi:hypothetical protein
VLDFPVWIAFHNPANKSNWIDTVARLQGGRRAKGVKRQICFQRHICTTDILRTPAASFALAFWKYVQPKDCEEEEHK